MPAPQMTGSPCTNEVDESVSSNTRRPIPAAVKAHEIRMLHRYPTLARPTMVTPATAATTLTTLVGKSDTADWSTVLAMTAW